MRQKHSSVRPVLFIRPWLMFILLVVGFGLAPQPTRALSSDLFFSEYIEGSSNNKALEIYNGTGAAIDLAAGGYNVQMYFNGSASPGLTINLTGVVANGDVFVLAQSSANATILAQADQTNGAGWFNGDDAVVLRKGTTIIDVIGQIGSDPGTEWGTGLTSTADNTLRRKASISAGDTNGADAFDPSIEWEGFATDTFGGLGSHSVTSTDTAPSVSSSNPTHGATNVATSANVDITFSEPVTVNGNWFQVVCGTSGTRDTSNTVVSGGPTTYSLNPNTDFVNGESCTLTVFAANVVDQDVNDPPDNMAANFTATFSTASVCTLAYTPIYQIQGSGLTSPLSGTLVTTQGIIVGDYEYPGSGSTANFLRGFYIQDASGDGDATTSDGLFVFNGNNNNVAVGDVVRVSGTVQEFQDQTQLGSVTAVVNCGTGTVAPVNVNFPVASATFLERYEGMLVRLPQTLYVTEHFQLGRFGQVVMSANARLQQPTNVVAPGAPAIALQAQNNLNRIIIDDASQAQNPDPILFGRGGNPLSASNTLRGGDTATGIVGVMTYGWAGNAASGNAYRVRPINALSGSVNFVAANPRPAAAPAVGGTVKVVGMNLLNFFNTFADNNASTPGCFPSGADSDCRGANSATEFQRQYQKTIAAILAMNPDVVGVNELENDGYGPTSALQFLVDQLNAATAPGTYAFINVDANTGQINAMGTDAIRVAQLYKPAVVTAVGQTAVLNTTSFVNGGDSAPRSRPSLAQAYRVNATGAVFIVDVNHLKSKGSACTAPDAGDGQGNCNQVRVNAATELVNWLATDPTGTGDPDVLLIGDYNSYAMEDPITVIKNAGYTNLISTLLGPDAYSYVFDGQWGYLDHALASASIVAQVTGIGDYHINADEPSVLDYNVEFKSAGQVASLYAPDQFRISDHDAVVIGLNPNAPPTVNAGGPYSVNEGGSVSLTASGSDPNGDSLTYAWDLDNNGSFETAGQNVTFSAASLDGPTSRTVKVKATDPGGLSAVAQATINVQNLPPTVVANPNAQSVQYSDSIASVTVTGTDVASDIPLAATTQWKVGAGAFAPGLPNGLTFSAANCGATSCAWTLSGQASVAPGSYVVRVTVNDKDSGSKFVDVTINVTQENAYVIYIGAVFASTSSASSNQANVTLAATVQDISVSPNPAGDAQPGDIRNATVTFIDRDTNTPIAGCINLPVGLVNAGNLQTGTATCNWSATISGDSQSFTIGIIVNNYYTRNHSDDDTLVTISKPLNNNFITGGGYLTLANSAGAKAGDAGSKANFGFNVKYNNSGKNLQGHINIIVRRSEADGLHVYQIKGNVMTSLAVQPSPCTNATASAPCTAVFNGKANIQDITNPLNPIAVDGNASLQVNMTDRGEPGSSDAIAITLWNKNGGLWFASNWDGAQPVEQTLAGGNLVVH